ncbi:Hypothetical protein HVR_LOCUS1087 [uncultured virus]|nr:Hypothetical protein HVR_LOCUS1087 [uncultured virus]
MEKYTKLKTLLNDNWSPILDGLNDNMSLSITDLSKSNISGNPIINEFDWINIDKWLKSMIDKKDENFYDKYLNGISVTYSPNDLVDYNTLERYPVNKQYVYLDEMFKNGITEIIWEICNTKNYRDKSEFLCKMNDDRYGFFICAQGSCGYGGCTVGGSYAHFYIGSLSEIYKLAMNDKDRLYHDKHYKM